MSGTPTDTPPEPAPALDPVIRYAIVALTIITCVLIAAGAVIVATGRSVGEFAGIVALAVAPVLVGITARMSATTNTRLTAVQQQTNGNTTAAAATIERLAHLLAAAPPPEPAAVAAVTYAAGTQPATEVWTDGADVHEAAPTGPGFAPHGPGVLVPTAG